MINLSASGGSVTFAFSGNSGYLQDGTIVVPVNSLSLIIDESDMVTFRKPNNDVFVSALLSEFGMTKDEMIAWYKANMVGSTGGGGGGGITSGEVQTMIDESISGKADTSAVTASLADKVNVVDNQVDGYGGVSSTAETYYGAGHEEWSFSADTYANAGYWACFGDGGDDSNRISGRIVIIDENDNVVEDYTIPNGQQATTWNPNSQYFTVTAASIYELSIETTGNYRIKYTNGMYSSAFPYGAVKYYETTYKYPSYQSAEAIENNVYPKFDELDASISGKADTSAVTEAISAATDDMATQTWVGEQGYITGVDLSDYATLQDIPDVSNYFDGAEYDSGTTRINFYHGNTIKAYIDASAFIIDGMIDDVRIETISGASYLVIDFNTASGKEDIQIPLTDIFNPDNYYNKSAIDGIVSGLTSRMTEDEEVTAAGLNAINDSLSGKVDTSVYSGFTADTNTALGNKQDTSGMTAYTQNTAFTAHTSDTTIHVTSAQTASWDAKSDFSGSYNDLTDKPTIPTVPTSNTAFTNDAGYITVDAISGKADSSAVTESISGLTERIAEDEEVTAAGLNALNDLLSGYAQTSAVTAEITEAVSGKVDASAITSSVTSASTDSEIPTAKAVYDAIPTGGSASYSAGRGIDITNDTISFSLPIYRDNRTGYDSNYGVKIGANDGTLNGLYSLVVGEQNTSQGRDSAIIGKQCKDYYGSQIFVGGYKSEIGNSNYSPECSFAFGNNVKAICDSEAAFGAFNTSRRDSSQASGSTIFSVGNGSSNNARHNAFEIRQNGDIYISSGGTDILLQDNLGKPSTSAVTSGSTDVITSGGVYEQFDGLKLQKVSQNEYDALVSGGTVDNNTLYVIS